MEDEVELLQKALAAPNMGRSMQTIRRAGRPKAETPRRAVRRRENEGKRGQLTGYEQRSTRIRGGAAL